MSKAPNSIERSGRGGGRLVVLSGPSGVGKSSINSDVARRTGAMFSVSVTTRPPRNGEVSGREYRFVDRAAFERMIERDELLEWAEIFGNLYGTPAGPVLEAFAADKVVLLEIDVQGALQVHEKMPEATFILVVPPDDEELQRRLRGRGTENAESFRMRYGKAKDELRIARDSKMYAHVVVNDNLETAIRDIVMIVKEHPGPSPKD